MHPANQAAAALPRIRDFRADDLAAILALQASCPLAAQWQPEHYARLAADPAGLVLVADLAAEDSGGKGLDGPNLAKLAGFVAFRGIGHEAELENLAVAAAYQRQGFAGQLVASGHARLRGTGVKRVLLEVRASNLQAISLYVSIGYKQDGIRKGYYRDPHEDACLLSIRP